MNFNSRSKADVFIMEGVSILFFAFWITCFSSAAADASTDISEDDNDGVLSDGPYTCLNLKNAAEMALKNNLTTLLADARTEEARGRVRQSISYLLPHVLLNIQQTRVYRENLASMGFPSFGVIGPYNAFDGRIHLVQQIFDWGAIKQLQAEQINIKIAQLDEELAAKQVRSAVSLAYLAALSAEEELAAAKADLDLARQLLKLGRHQNVAGLAKGIDVARFETREAEEDVRCLQATMDLRKSFIELDRVIGLPLDTNVKLTDSMGFVLEHILPVSEEIDFADQNRTELKIAHERIQYHEFKLKEAKSQRWPTVGFMGDYGLDGDTPNNSLPSVGEIGVVLNMPIFDGGMISGETKTAESNRRQSQLIFDDLGKQVQEDVRLALQSLTISAKQVKAAKKVFALANRELEMSRDLFSAGIGDNIEVINAQTALARSRQQYVSMLFQYNMARVNLYSALGNVETFSIGEPKGK
jgi:outer membrane protein TolC